MVLRFSAIVNQHAQAYHLPVFSISFSGDLPFADQGAV